MWAKYEYEIELHLYVLKFPIKFGFDTIRDGKDELKCLKLLQLVSWYGKKHIQYLHLLQKNCLVTLKGLNKKKTAFALAHA